MLLIPDKLKELDAILDPEAAKKAEEKRLEKEKADKAAAEQPKAKSKAEEDLWMIVENEYSADVEELVRKMKKWRNTAFGLGVVIFITGMMLCFLWVGSLDTDAQRAWLKAFGEFFFMSAVITAPFFLLVASAFQAWEERKKQRRIRAEAKIKELEAKAAAMSGPKSPAPVPAPAPAPGGPAKPAPKKPALGSAEDMMAKAKLDSQNRVKMLVQAELGRNIKNQLLTFHIF